MSARTSEWSGGPAEPAARLFRNERQKFPTHVGVIGVEPVDFLARHQERSTSRRSIGASVSVSKRLSGFSAPRLPAPRSPAPDSRCGCRSGRSCNSPARWTGSCRASAPRSRAWKCAPVLHAPRDSCRRRDRCRDRSRARPPIDGARAKLSSCAPVMPSGNTARAMAMWPLSTRVKRSRISSVGSPTIDGAGDVGGAVQILGAGIDQERRARERSCGWSCG